MRWWRYGDPLFRRPRRRKKKPMWDRFWSKVDQTDDCWVWTSCRNPQGYGVFQVANTSVATAHRVAWVLANGRAVPDGMFVCHSCDNPPCVRPDHLFIGTHIDNVADMLAKGRHARVAGERHSQAKFTDREIQEVRVALAVGESVASVAARFGMSERYARRIRQGAARTRTSA
jgi:hypothetical protein